MTKFPTMPSERLRVFCHAGGERTPVLDDRRTDVGPGAFDGGVAYEGDVGLRYGATEDTQPLLTN